MLPPRGKLKCATLNFLFYVDPLKFAAPSNTIKFAALGQSSLLPPVKCGFDVRSGSLSYIPT